MHIESLLLFTGRAFLLRLATGRASVPRIVRLGREETGGVRFFEIETNWCRITFNWSGWIAVAKGKSIK